MLENNPIKICLLILLTTHFIIFFTPLIIIRKKGFDPHGTHKNYSLLARITPISYFLLIIYIISYIFFSNVIDLVPIFTLFSEEIYVIIGIIIIILGLLFESLGIITLGINFRVELPKEETKLITSGIYRFMRNPIAFSMYLFVIGIFLMTPNILSLIISIMNIITFNAKVSKEELFLLEIFGDDYKEYKSRVGRYFPLILKKK